MVATIGPAPDLVGVSGTLRGGLATPSPGLAAALHRDRRPRAHQLDVRRRAPLGHLLWAGAVAMGSRTSTTCLPRVMRWTGSSLAGTRWTLRISGCWSLWSCAEAVRSAHDNALGGRYLRHGFGVSVLLIQSYGSR